MPACMFCGSTWKMSGEHVLGQGLSRIGLDMTPVPHGVGQWNELTHEMGVRRPFQQTVRDVCEPCNTGWMSDLERDARRCLTPFILGQIGALEPADVGSIAAWVEKTALTSMFVSSEEQRDNGYGLPAIEYHALNALAGQKVPLPTSQFWIGRYTGSCRFAVEVTPIAVRIDGLPEADVPQGYVITIVLGQLILHGVRFTTPSLETKVSTRQQLPQFWPPTVRATWPDGDPIDDAQFLDFARGKCLRAAEPNIKVQPWTPAVELPRSGLIDGMIELPAPCRMHMLYYPAVLAQNAQSHGHVYAFHATCDCPHTYLYRTLPDGTRLSGASKSEADVVDMYKQLPGEKLIIRSKADVFGYKRLTACT